MAAGTLCPNVAGATCTAAASWRGTFFGWHVCRRKRHHRARTLTGSGTTESAVQMRSKCTGSLCLPMEAAMDRLALLWGRKGCAGSPGGGDTPAAQDTSPCQSAPRAFASRAQHASTTLSSNTDSGSASTRACFMACPTLVVGTLALATFSSAVRLRSITCRWATAAEGTR